MNHEPSNPAPSSTPGHEATPLKILFLCNANQRRSTTAEHLLRGLPGYDVQSAGTEPGARKRLTADLVEWADFIFGMEDRNLRRLQKDFKDLLPGKRVINLNVPDRYGGMSLELTDLLKQKLRRYIAVPS